MLQYFSGESDFTTFERNWGFLMSLCRHDVTPKACRDLRKGCFSIARSNGDPISLFTAFFDNKVKASLQQWRSNHRRAVRERRRGIYDKTSPSIREDFQYMLDSPYFRVESGHNADYTQSWLKLSYNFETATALQAALNSRRAAASTRCLEARRHDLLEIPWSG